MIAQASVQELKQALDEGRARLIDVREQFEFVDAHVTGSQWIPMSLVPLRKDEFASEAPVYVICRTGNRSGQVVMWLERQGIPAINVDGGVVAWAQSGWPLASGME